jgi:PAS domain-containing protein
VTDRPTLEETIALLEATLEATHDGILVLDLEHRVIRYNRLFARMLRIPSEAIDRGNADDLLRGIVDELEDPDAFARRSEELARSRPPTTDLLRFKDGRVFERSVAPHRIGPRSSGGSLRLGPALRAEQALVARREGAGDRAHGSWVRSSTGPTVSAVGRTAFGVPLGQFEGTSEPLRSFDDRALARGQRAGAAGQPYDIEHRVVRPTAACWVHEKASIVGDAQGRPLRMAHRGHRASSRISCGSRRRWRRSAASPAASRTI